jgi:hypothetical protein
MVNGPLTAATCPHASSPSTGSSISDAKAEAKTEAKTATLITALTETRNPHRSPDFAEDRDRSNFNKIRDELAASFRKTCTARRTAFSNVMPMVTAGE